MGRLEGKTAAITGGGGGFAHKVALTFAREGANLVLTDLNMESLEKVKADIDAHNYGVKVGIYQGNIGKEADVKKVFDAAKADFGHIDILVNNAGLSRNTKIQDMTMDEWQLFMDVNLTSVFLCSREVIPGMIERQAGKIINTSSIAGVTGRMGGLHYGTTKAGIVGFTRNLAAHVAADGINVNAVAPGPVMSPVWKDFTQEQIEGLMKSVIFKRWGEPEDIANLMLFLASSESDWITGEVINVNGGAFIG